MFITGIVLILGTCVVGSPLLTLRALSLRSWVMMWIAALISLLLGSVLIFSLGAAIFLLTNLQVAATYILRRGLTRADALKPFLLAIFLWILIVPFQFFGPVWFGGFGYLPVMDVAFLVVLLLPINWSAYPTAFRS